MKSPRNGGVKLEWSELFLVFPQKTFLSHKTAVVALEEYSKKSIKYELYFSSTINITEFSVEPGCKFKLCEKCPLQIADASFEVVWYITIMKHFRIFYPFSIYTKQFPSIVH